MKRAFLLTYSLLLCFLTSMAQHKVIISLTDGTTIEKDVWEVESITFGNSDPISIIEPADTTEAVDLGLSVKWANANIQFEEGKSLLIGWGDVSGKVQSEGLDYYPMPVYYDNIVNGEYDMARALWGDGWRLPSEKEVRELIDSCEWTAVYSKQDNSFLGYNVTGPSGESIFMPVTGKRCGMTIDDVLSGYYWTGIISPDPQQARYLTFAAPQSDGGNDGTDETEGEVTDETVDGSQEPVLESMESLASISEAPRHMGFAVRPVYGPYKVGVSVNVNLASNIQPHTAMITAVFEGDLKDIEEFGLRYSTSEEDVMNASGNVETISLQGSELETNGIHTFNLSGLDYAQTYYYQAYANVAHADSVSDIKHFESAAKYTVEWVDLHLPSGLLWASYNLSATNVYDKGNLYAWADPDEVCKDQNTYPWLVEDSLADIAFTEYDVVHKVLGGEAHLPNTYDFLELKKYCIWKYKPADALTPAGWFVKRYSTSQDSIFLPFTGVRQYDGTPYHDGTVAYFWTSENCTNLQAKCYTFSTSAGISGMVSNENKYLGMSIRPVCGKSNKEDPYVPKYTYNESEYDNLTVDLGLSVYWASQNVGASAPELTGDLYAWGDTVTRDNFTLDNYPWFDGNNFVVLQINGESISNIAGTEYDVAYLKWGGDWTMPNQEQWLELMNECDWTWETLNGVPGYRVTSRYNQKSIFLAAPYGDSGSYWSSSMCTREGAYKNNSSYYLQISQSKIPSFCNMDYRYYGRMIRPVRKLPRLVEIE